MGKDGTDLWRNKYVGDVCFEAKVLYYKWIKIKSGWWKKMTVCFYSHFGKLKPGIGFLFDWVCSK